MVQAVNSSFQEFITNLDRQLTSTASKEKKPDGEHEIVLLIFDEIDKWLKSYINNEIHKLREKSRSQKQVKDDKNNSSVVEHHEKLTEQEEQDEELKLKSQYLDQLYKLVDGHILPDTRKYVIIFNTNEFESMFTDVDSRYAALQDRFERYKFK